jgi:hypothetical protein
MYVVWGQVSPIVQTITIGASSWQHLDQFENVSFAKVVKDNSFLFS